MSKYPEGYYVYEHYLPGQYVPMYVGKGKAGRAWEFKKRNDYWHNKVAKYGEPRVVIVEAGLTEARAFELEIVTIDFYKQSGVELTNLTTGGDGIPLNDDIRIRRAATLRKTVRTDEHRAKISAISKAALARPNVREKLSIAAKANGAKPEVKAKISAAHKALYKNPEYKAKISAALKAALASPEARALKSERSRQTWGKTEVRERRLLGMVAAQNRPEVKAKLSAAFTGRKSPVYNHTRYVFEHTDGTVFIGTQYELCDMYGVRRGNIPTVIRGARKSVNGWRYVGEYKEAA